MAQSSLLQLCGVVPLVAVAFLCAPLLAVPCSQPHFNPFIADLIRLLAKAMISDSHFATVDSSTPVESGSTPFHMADFEDDAEYKAVYSNVKSRGLALLTSIAKAWPAEALSEAVYLTSQMVHGSTFFLAAAARKLQLHTTALCFSHACFGGGWRCATAFAHSQVSCVCSLRDT
jgi:hypothetical protein